MPCLIISKELKMKSAISLEMREMSQSITIPKEEYESLIECKRIVELEFDRPISKELLRKLEEAKRDIISGKGAAFHSKSEIQKYFKSM